MGHMGSSGGRGGGHLGEGDAAGERGGHAAEVGCHLGEGDAAGERGGHAAEDGQAQAELGGAQGQALHGERGQGGDGQDGGGAERDGAPGRQRARGLPAPQAEAGDDEDACADRASGLLRSGRQPTAAGLRRAVPTQHDLVQQTYTGGCAQLGVVSGDQVILQPGSNVLQNGTSKWNICSAKPELKRGGITSKAPHLWW